MHKRIQFSLILTLLCFTADQLVSQKANAAIEKIVFEATVNNISDFSGGLSGAVSLGDTFTWSVIYNNSLPGFTRYDDGANGIGEFGEGDDTVVNTFGIGTSSDAVVDFSGLDSIVSAYYASPLTSFEDIYDTTESYVRWTGSGRTDNDYEQVFRQDNFLFRIDIGQSPALFSFATLDTRTPEPTDLTLDIVGFSFEILSVTNPINSPASMLSLSIIAIALFKSGYLFSFLTKLALRNSKKKGNTQVVPS